MPNPTKTKSRVPRNPMIDRLTGRDMSVLTHKEMDYYKLMKPKSGVLYITAPPGLAKSAIARNIAEKMGFAYHDLRLSQIDETDVGLYPKVKEGEYLVDGVRMEKMDYLAHVIPEWALRANERPTIIHFEELNRAPLAVRNAALQILLERRIGLKFEFNERVLMIASGNLGEADGTDVEAFDKALNNRLIHVRHDLTVDEWIEGYARENVHPSIVNFLRTNAEHFHKPGAEDGHMAYASPRTWTFLSDYINENYWTDDGQPPQVREFISDVRAKGHSFVGASNVRFLRYLEESLRFTIQDVLDRYDQIRDELETFNRDKKSELLASLRERKVIDMNPDQMENVKKFVLSLSDDESLSYLLKVIDDEYTLMEDNTPENSASESFLLDERFRKFHQAILEHCEVKR